MTYGWLEVGVGIGIVSALGYAVMSRHDGRTSMRKRHSGSRTNPAYFGNHSDASGLAFSGDRGGADPGRSCSADPGLACDAGGRDGGSGTGGGDGGGGDSGGGD